MIAGAKKTSEGFETSNGILLWGAFEYGIPLMASHKFESVVKRQVEQQKKGEKGKKDDDDFIEEVTYGNVIDELELGDNFIDE